MQLKDYQLYTLNKLIKHKKSFVFWPRQTGKSCMISSYIENHIINNKDTNIVFVVNYQRYIATAKIKLLKDIGSSIIDMHRTDGIFLLNNNYLSFISIEIDLEKILNMKKPSLIIYDDFRVADVTKLKKIRDYIDKVNCKISLTSTFLDFEMIKFMDYNNDFYISIMPPTLILDNNEFSYNFDKDPNLNKRLIIKNLSYKPDELLEYSDTIFQRKQKLRKLNKISNE